MENKIFTWALIISCILHIVAFVRLSYSNIHHRTTPLKTIEVTYQILGGASGLQSPARVKAQPVDERLKNKTEVFIDKKHDTPPFMKDLSKKAGIFDTHQKEPVRASSVEKKRIVSVPALKSEEIKIPEYQLYYHDIRNRIKKRAISNIDFSKLDTGDVYLTFVVLADGTLQQMRILDSRTNASKYLRTISLQSVREAGESFAPFPEDLAYPELPFNVVISYQLEE